jgi:hypothetical protein
MRRLVQRLRVNARYNHSATPGRCVAAGYHGADSLPIGCEHRSTGLAGPRLRVQNDVLYFQALRAKEYSGANHARLLRQYQPAVIGVGEA